MDAPASAELVVTEDAVAVDQGIFPYHGEHARYIAIESNPRTRIMYAKLGIPCFWVTEEGTSVTDGMRIVKRLL